MTIKDRIQTYFADERISQSFLKKYFNNNPRFQYRPEKEDNKYYNEKTHFLKGSLTDLLICEPENIYNYYSVDKMEKKPSKAIMSIVKYIYDNNLDFNDKNILEACEFDSYQSRWKDETKINTIKKEGTEYYQSLVLSKDKQIVSKEELELCTIMANSISTGEYTRGYFTDNEFTEVLYQKDFYGTIFGEECKGLLDVLRLDHINKTFQVIDIKTTGDYLEDFSLSVYRRRYDIQLAFYQELVQQHYSDYTALNPVLLAVSKKEPEFAEPFELNQQDLFTSMYGSKSKLQIINNKAVGVERIKPIIGIQQLIENYKWSQNKLYNKELEENKVNKLTLF